MAPSGTSRVQTNSWGWGICGSSARHTLGVWVPQAGYQGPAGRLSGAHAHSPRYTRAPVGYRGVGGCFPVGFRSSGAAVRVTVTVSYFSWFAGISFQNHCMLN